MATTLGILMVALRDSIAGLRVRGTEGIVWQALPFSLSGQEPSWAHGSFRVMPAGGGSVGMPGAAEAHVNVDKSFGLVDEQTLSTTLGVRFFRTLAGDPDSEEPAFLDELVALGAWIERKTTWPEGTQTVQVEGYRIERDPAERSWGSGIVFVTVRWHAAFTASEP